MSLGTIGKYERLDVLGHGASGIVYLARDTLLRRQVAIKEVSAQGEERDRLLEEARLLDRLRHRNIVEVHSVDTVAGKVVIDMEYVDGRNLLEILRAAEGPLPIPQCIDIAAQVCDGLAYAQARRIVHRDIKPANILVSRSGAVKLVDFGLALVLGTNSFIGGAGTYAYMAPEDFDEDAASDAQSDLWALGVILYEMLTGRRPFSVARPKDPFAWKRAVESQPIESPRSVRAEIPAALSAICLTALARDRGLRYKSAEAMGAALHALDFAPASIAMGLGAAAGSSEPAGLTTRPMLLGASDVDTFLAAATDDWARARAALTSGELAHWLEAIDEGPLSQIAETAAQESGESGADGDALLRDFLYRAGLDTAGAARRSAAVGSSFLRAGAHDDAAAALLTAIRLDPAHPAYFLQLYKALLSSGDYAAAAVAISCGLEHHPRDRALRRSQAEISAGAPTVSQAGIDFGALRHGDKAKTRIVVRNSSPSGALLQGRIESLPAWIDATPMTFVTRHQQPIAILASTDYLWEREQEYDGRIMLSTSGGPLEIAVRIAVKAPLRSFEDVFHWFLPLTIAALCPLIAGLAATLNHRGSSPFYAVGLLASGLLFGAFWAVCGVAETRFFERLVTALGACFAPIGAYLFWMNRHDHALSLPLIVTVLPAGALLLAQGIVMLRYPRTWGRWPIWGWAVAVIAAAVTAAFLDVAQVAVVG